MRSWLMLLSGFILWTIHFFALYIAASAFPGQPPSYWLTGLITILCLAGVAFAVMRAKRGDGASGMDRWVRTVGLCGLGLSGIAIIWQGLPALIV